MLADFKGNIAILENKEKITAEDLLESMIRLFDGLEGKKLSIENPEKWGINFVNLLDRVDIVYNNEASKILELDDDDVNDVVRSLRQYESELYPKREILQKLMDEKEKFEKVYAEYEAAKAKQQELEIELSRLKIVSADDVKIEVERLQQEMQKRKEMLLEIEQTDKKRSELANETEQLKDRVEANKKIIFEAEKEECELNKAIQDYEEWREDFERNKEARREKTVDAINAFTVIKNAWRSLMQKEDISSQFESIGCFQSVEKDIKSFSDLKNWFEEMGMNLDKLTEVYAEMFNNAISVLEKNVR